MWKLKDTIGCRSGSIESRLEQVAEAQHGRQIGTGLVVITSRPQARPIAPEAKAHPIVAVPCASSDADARMQRQEEERQRKQQKKKTMMELSYSGRGCASDAPIATLLEGGCGWWVVCVMCGRVGVWA